MTDGPTPPPAPRSGPTWATPSGPPAAPRPQGPGVPSPIAPKKRRPVLTHGAVALVALVIGVGIGQSGGSADDGKKAAASTTTSPAATAPAATAPSPAPTAAPSTGTPTTETPTTQAPTTEAPKPATTKPAVKPKPTAKPGPPTSFDGDGEYLVGEDIAAGTYRTAGPADFGCYWERDKDSSGEFDSIIANDNLSGSGRVTVRMGEVFKTQGCQTWKKVA
ncbi:hypothetical protein [Streptomyces sp. HPF1205]|uniref:hypothetical protein n=1 Tax=Streptomyces sp. HPF1205 TaxID=2873262 RepID=UPI001CEDD843|nr:hypothetical protein [Streptomyces sp. HPF1205]